MCRALLVLCVAADPDALARLKRAAVAAEWELAPGATNERDALAQLEEVRPHVLVLAGPFDSLVESARDRVAAIRIVGVGPIRGADVVVDSLADVRAAVVGGARPGGPVRSS
jgi:hypothetical protein